MRRFAVALAALAAVWATPVIGQSDTKERDVSCLAVMAFAVAALDNPQEDGALRVYFAYFLGRLNAQDPNEKWADRGIARLKTMDADQLQTSLVACADVADREFLSSMPTPTTPG